MPLVMGSRNLRNPNDFLVNEYPNFIMLIEVLIIGILYNPLYNWDN